MNSIICLILLLVSLLFFLKINKENYASYGGWRWIKTNKNEKPSESDESESAAGNSDEDESSSGSGESGKNKSLGIQVKNNTPPKKKSKKEEEDDKRKQREEDDKRILSNRCLTADNCNVPYQKKILKIVGQPDTKRWSEYLFEPTETNNYNKNDAKNIANDEVLYSERNLKEFEYDVDQQSRMGIPLRGKLHSQMKKVKKKQGSCLEIQATSDDQLLNEHLFKNKTAIENFKPNLLRTKLWENSGHVLNENYVNPFDSKDLSPLKAPLLNNYETNSAKKPSQFEVIKEVDKYYNDKFPKCIGNKNELKSYIDGQIQKKYDENISNEKYFLATAREYREAGSCHKLLKTKEKLKIFSLDNHIMYDEPVSNKLKIKQHDSDLSEIHIKTDILTPKTWGSKITNTIKGERCFPWKTARGGKKSYFAKSDDDNACGDPDGDGFDWCYTSNGPRNYWGKCNKKKSNQFFLALIGKGDYSPEVSTKKGCCGLAISLIYEPMLSKDKAILALTNVCNEEATEDGGQWGILAQKKNIMLSNNTRYQIDIYYDTITGLTKIWKNGELAFSTTIPGGQIKKGYISLGSGCHSKVFKPWTGKIYKMDIFSGKPSWVDDGAGKPVEGFTSGSSAKKYYDKTISKNRGKPKKNPHGNRRLNPKNAPYEKYLSQLSGKLNNVELKYHKMSGTKKIKENFKQNKFIKKNTNKFLNAEQNIKKKIKKDQSKIMKKKIKKKCNVETFTKSKSKKNKGRKNKPKKIKAKRMKKVEKFNQKIDSNIPQANPINNIEKEEFNKKNFANAEGKKPVVDKPFDFKPKVEFKHEQPEKKIASAYGWSYIPPQYWSVPQKRPPVCIPAAGTEEIVRPLYDKGTPVNALEWNQVGSIIPKFEYKTVYNPNYYYPGWIAQDNVNYPKKGAVSTEYYNNNPATATKPNQGN